MSLDFQTADLCDQHEGQVQVVTPLFRDFGGAMRFAGRIMTVEVFEDNQLVRETLARPGEGRVLVVDGGGSLRCALLGDRLATMAHENGWVGVVIYGCVRDSLELAMVPLGIKALNAHPQRSSKGGAGAVNVMVSFGAVTFRPGDYLYADADGIVLAEFALL